MNLEEERKKISLNRRAKTAQKEPLKGFINYSELTA